VLVYNHKGVIEYGSECIRIATRKATVKISGIDLTIKAMNRENLSVIGQIIGVEFSYGG
jgi:sporulation protein YqfC